jgi:hypothetical protein
MGYRIGHAEPHDFDMGDMEKERDRRKCMQKPRVVEDMYGSNRVTGENVNVHSHPVPHTGYQSANQYGGNRTITGGKGKKK